MTDSTGQSPADHEGTDYELDELDQLARNAVQVLRSHIKSYHTRSCDCAACVAIGVLDGYHCVVDAVQAQRQPLPPDPKDSEVLNMTRRDLRLLLDTLSRTLYTVVTNNHCRLDTVTPKELVR